MNASQLQRAPIIVIVLIIVAHPDDETICAGGTMALLASRGVDVTVACSTRGEGGVSGDPPLCRTKEGKGGKVGMKGKKDHNGAALYTFAAACPPAEAFSFF
ncbi:MAG: PIG-L family deacetylase, partial [Chloroflexota bacterium]|nr:PIG-L family deacetylase [Chloroflexota bacterium]